MYLGCSFIMLEKILVANRGEIACRIIKTARDLGIRTVSVYSEVDSGSFHVRMADESVALGGSSSVESYLDIGKLVRSAVMTGCQAVHPGYGFLSENAEFIESLAAEGIGFVGPSVEAVRLMGLKDAAKEIMEKSGVPVLSGYQGDNQRADFMLAEAKRIGFPVLIKARAGGGGKGVRLVESEEDFVKSLAGAKREALASFGDDICLIEKYVVNPRHIEVQVLGDNFGTVLYLFERDCSLQRRYQKVLEEAPAPFMDGSLRKVIGETAVNAAKSIGYVGAGTVEFIVGDMTEEGFWFMEMNTRLQVEHPVTEAITGLDLVEWQLRIASGEKIPFGQEDLMIDGHSLEARLYAEDVYNDFLPMTGRISQMNLPERAVFFTRSVLRLDMSVEVGEEITPYYDPMIGKIIVHGSTREESFREMVKSLDELHISGVTTNRDFLIRLCRDDDVLRGEVDTGLISRRLDSLKKTCFPSLEILGMAVLSGLGLLEDDFDGLRCWRAWGTWFREVELFYDGEKLRLGLEGTKEGVFTVVRDRESLTMRARGLGEQKWLVQTSGGDKKLDILVDGENISIFYGGSSWNFYLPLWFSTGEDIGFTEDIVISPMPGFIKYLYVSEGDEVIKGEELLVLEAMKMEHTLVSPRDGMIGKIGFRVGEQVGGGVTLIELDSVDDD